MSFLSSTRCLLGLDGYPLLDRPGNQLYQEACRWFPGLPCTLVGRLDGEAVVSVPQKHGSFWLARLNGTVAVAVYSKSKMHSPFALYAHLSGRWQTMSGFTASFTHSTV